MEGNPVPRERLERPEELDDPDEGLLLGGS